VLDDEVDRFVRREALAEEGDHDQREEGGDPHNEPRIDRAEPVARSASRRFDRHLA